MKIEPRQWPHDKLPDSLKENARRMRKEPTAAEEKLWEILRNRKLDGFKFRRQQPFEGFIIDFYCEEAKLGIEVDGEIHQHPDQKQYDREREEYIREFGVEIVRFTNEQMEKDIKGVKEKITKTLKERIASNPSPLPLSQGRGVSEGRGEGLKYFRFSSYYKNPAGFLPHMWV